MKNPEKSKAEILLEVIPPEQVQAWERNNIQTAGKSLQGMMNECAKVPSYKDITLRSVLFLFSGLFLAVVVSVSVYFLVGAENRPLSSIISLMIVGMAAVAASILYCNNQNKRRDAIAPDRKLLKKFVADAMLLLHPTTDLVAYSSVLKFALLQSGVGYNLVQLAWIIISMRGEFDKVRLKPERHLERLAKLSAAILEHEATFEEKWKAALTFEYYKPEDKGWVFAEAERQIITR